MTQQNRLHALYEVTTSQALSEEERFQAALEVTAAFLDMQRGTISHVNGSISTLLYGHDFEVSLETGLVVPIAQSPDSLILKARDLVAIENLSQSSYADSLFSGQPIEALIGTPVWVNGDLFGSLSFTDRFSRPTEFDQEDQDIVRMLGQWVGISLECLLQAHMLRESEMRYDILFDGTVEGILFVEEGVIADANPAFQKMTGFSRQEIIGSHLSDFITREWRDFVARNVNEQSESPIEAVGLRSDGSGYPLILQGRNVARKGLPVWMVTVRDLSDRDRAEVAEREQQILADVLRDSAATLNSTLNLDDVLDNILNNIGQVVPHDAASIMLVEGDAARIVRTRGFSKHGGKQAAKVVDSLEFSLHESTNLREIVTTGLPLIVSDVLDYADWQVIDATAWIRSYAGMPIRSEGEVIGILNLDSAAPNFFTEVHAERLKAFADQAAAAIKNANLYTKSQQRNQQLALLNRITRISAAVLEMTDLLQALSDSIAMLIGGDGCFITLWDEESQQPLPGAAYGAFDAAYQKMFPTQPGEITLAESAIREGRPLVIEDIMDSPYISPRLAVQLPVESALVVPLLANERDLGALVVAFSSYHQFDSEEIAWMVQAAELIALAISKAEVYAELESRNRELDAFSYTVAHDLKSPLATMIGALDLLRELEASNLTAEGREMLRVAERSSGRMVGIIESLLLLAQLQSAQKTICPVEMLPVIETAVERHKNDIDGRGVSITIDPNLPDVMGYDPWLEEVFANLISNAVKYIGDDNEDPQILIRAFRKDGYVRYEVVDNGLGVAEEDQDRLFEMFTRFHVTANKGFGLGLSIVQRIIHKLNGQIGVVSAPGEGSTFWFALPAAE
ncbi:MAG: GAF domain-containing protein [Anaerolineae bacterium]|nr:GAF domain-containing protein [Anaerolineae bacterium]